MARSIWITGLVVAVVTALTGLLAESEPMLLVQTVVFYTLLAVLLAAGVRVLWRRRTRAQSATAPEARTASDAAGPRG